MQKKCLVFLVIIFAIVGFSYSQTKNECNTRVKLHIPIGFGKQITGSSGEVIYCEESKGRFKGEISLKGLAPSHFYILTINGKPGQDGNDLLPQRYNNEGYFDFQEIETDSNGNYKGRFNRKLKIGDYDVKFFVKDKSDFQIVLHNDFLFFTIN